MEHFTYLKTDKKTAIILLDIWEEMEFGENPAEDMLAQLIEAKEQTVYLNPYINFCVDRLREEGHLIIHAPCHGTHNHADEAAYRNADRIHDRSVGGPQSSSNAIIRQAEDIVIAENDYLTECPNQFFAILEYHNIEKLVYIGYSLQWCIRTRPVGALVAIEQGYDVSIAANLTRPFPTMDFDFAVKDMIRAGFTFTYI